METFLLLVLFVLLVSGIIWFIKKIEATNCDHDDCITHCKFETQNTIQIEQKPEEPKAVEVDFSAIRPGATPVVVKEQPARKPRKPRKPRQSQPVQQVQKAQPVKAQPSQPAKKAQPKPAVRTAKPAKPRKPSN